MGMTVSWRSAMAEALYGRHGFYTRAGGGAGGHFRTSARACDLFAAAILRLLVGVDEAIGRPDPLDVVDIGAGDGHLLRRLAVLAPADLGRRLRLSAVELAARPPDLPDRIGWYDELPPRGTITGAVLATEWLDNVPIDVAEFDDAGLLRYVLVEPTSGEEVSGDEVAGPDAAWAQRWWAEVPRGVGVRVELGSPRDEAWAQAVAGLSRGLALAVDYGHLRHDRPAGGTMAAFRSGRTVPPVPDGSRDITAHVAIDAVCAAGEAVAGQGAALTTQRVALRALGLDSVRPALSLATEDPLAYVRALSAATQAAELVDAEGLGGHYWVLQPVGLPAEWLPASVENLSALAGRGTMVA
jgi:SAM-dependent MidA family methyltransferase